MPLDQPLPDYPPRTGGSDDTYTLLCVLSGGLPILLDLMPAGDWEQAQFRARRLLAEHPSCASVEIWLNERLMGVEARTDAPAGK
jgi:hypothetical protein